MNQVLIFFLPLIGLYILFTVHSLTLFRHRSAIVFPERNDLQRQSSVPSRCRCRCSYLQIETIQHYVINFVSDLRKIGNICLYIIVHINLNGSYRKCVCVKMNQVLGLWCLTPLSAIVQLTRGGHFYWWGNRNTRRKLPIIDWIIYSLHSSFFNSFPPP
jgi:hypothetical protein